MTVLEMRELHTAKLDEADKILADNETLTEELTAKIDELRAEAERLRTEIETREKVAAERSALKDPPVSPTPRPEPGAAPQPQPERRATVTGPVPRLQNIRETRSVRMSDGSVREMRADERAYALGRWIHAINGCDESRQWCAANGWETRVMKEATGGGGGYLVPEPMADDVIINVEQYGVARQVAAVRQMTRDTLSVPRLDTEVTTYWVGEGASITASDAALDQVNLTARKLACLTRVSNELMDDSIVAMADFVAGSAGRAIAKAEDDAAFLGDGTSTYGGIMGLAGEFEANESLTGVVTASSDDDTFAEILLADLNKLVGTCPAYALPNARWLCSQMARGYLFDRLAGAGGGASHATLVNGVISTWMGYPITVSASMPAGAATDYSEKMMVAFGDFSRGMIFGDRKSISVQILNELYAATDETGIKVTERLDVNFYGYGTTSAAGPVLCLMGD